MSEDQRRWPNDGIKFWLAGSFDSEGWQGPFESREAALEKAREDYATDPENDDGSVCWISSGAYRQPNFVPDEAMVQQILEDFVETNQECWFEEEPVDPRDAKHMPELAAGIGDLLEHFIDPPSSRMIEDFRTLEAVVRKGGQLVIDPELVP